MASNGTNLTNPDFLSFINGPGDVTSEKDNISVKAFVLNIAVGLGLFTFEFSGFLLLKSSAIGRRI